MKRPAFAGKLNPGHLACAASALPLSYDTEQVHTEDCAEQIEDCEGWWLSRCHSSVAEHWLHKPGVLGLIPGDCQPFHFPLFSPHNISLFQHDFEQKHCISEQRPHNGVYYKFRVEVSL